MCIFLTQYNVLLSLADYLSPHLWNVFDGEVAKGSINMQVLCLKLCSLHTVKTKVGRAYHLSPTAHQKSRIGELAETNWWALPTYVFTVQSH